MLGLPPRLDRPLRLLGLGAHADDLEIGAGGTVLRLLKAYPGAQVRWAVLSGGDGPRAAEAHAAAAALLADAGEAHVTVARFRDGYFPFDGAAIKQYVEGELKPFSPDLILTHARDDRHQDHRLVSDLAYTAFRSPRQRILEYEIPKWDGDQDRPNVYAVLDDATAERKLDLLDTHFPSQHDKGWYDGDTFRGLLRLRGVEAGARWAEAFTVRKQVWP